MQPISSSSKRLKLDVDSTAEDPPDDVIRSILLKLPVKSLIRFWCLSKRWQETIMSSSFTKQHMNNLRDGTSIAASCNIVCSLNSSRDEEYVLELLSHRISSVEYGKQIIQPTKMPLRFRFGNELERFLFSFDDYGSCDGLICIEEWPSRDSLHSFIHIYNPATGKHKKLPWPDNKYYDDMYLGFGYEPSIDDYKIVIFGGVAGKLRVQVMKLKESTWRVVDLRTTFPLVLDLAHPPFNFISLYVSVKGEVYWICETQLGDLYLLKFKLSEESFSLLPLPEGEGGKDNKASWRLVTFNGSVVLFIIWESNIYIWMLKEGETWYKVSSIPRKNELGQELVPVGFNMSGDVIMVNLNYGTLVAYNLRENRFVKLNVAHNVVVSFPLHFVQMETLVSP